MPSPTPYPDVNAVLLELGAGAREVLGNHFVAMYLSGSLATGDFDIDSDIDFIVVTDEVFSALQGMHSRIAAMDSRWARELEGAYIPQHSLRRYDPAHSRRPHIERDPDKRVLVMEHLDQAWLVQRHIVREQGVALAGPSPQTLIDPISPADLWQATLTVLHAWGAPMHVTKTPFNNRGHQSFTVLSLCRMLYTLEFGDVVSKRVTAKWAQEALDEQWIPMIARAWIGRHNPTLPPEADDVKETLEFVRYALARAEERRKAKS